MRWLQNEVNFFVALAVNGSNATSGIWDFILPSPQLDMAFPQGGCYYLYFLNDFSKKYQKLLKFSVKTHWFLENVWRNTEFFKMFCSFLDFWKLSTFHIQQAILFNIIGFFEKFGKLTHFSKNLVVFNFFFLLHMNYWFFSKIWKITKDTPLIKKSMLNFFFFYKKR